MILNSLCDPYARKILYTRTLCSKYCCYKIGNVLTVMPSHLIVEDYRLLDSLVSFIPKPDCACIEKRAQRAQETLQSALQHFQGRFGLAPISLQSIGFFKRNSVPNIQHAQQVLYVWTASKVCTKTRLNIVRLMSGRSYVRGCTRTQLKETQTYFCFRSTNFMRFFRLSKNIVQ